MKRKVSLTQIVCLGIQKENMTKKDLFLIKCKVQTRSPCIYLGNLKSIAESQVDQYLIPLSKISIYLGPSKSIAQSPRGSIFKSPFQTSGSPLFKKASPANKGIYSNR